MEYAFRQDFQIAAKMFAEVAILVIMEYAFRQIYQKYKKASHSRNPCYNGICF